MRGYKKFIFFPLLTIIFLVIYLFFFYRLDLIKDLPRNICSTGAFNLKLNQARERGEPLSSVTEYFYKRWSYIPGIFYPGIPEWYTMSIPLTQLILTGAFKFLSPSAEAVIIVCSLISSLAIILTYILGKRMFNHWVGFISALLMASSLFIIIPSRIGYIFFSLESLNGALGGLFLFLAFTLKNRKLFFISSFFLALGCFNGHTGFVFYMPVFFVFISLSEFLFKKQKIFSLKDYLSGGILAFIFYLLFRFGYALFFHASPITVLKWSYLGFADRQAQIPTIFNQKHFLLGNIERFVRLMFIKSQFGKVGADAWYLFLPGRPMLHPFVTGGFFLGIVFLFLKRDFCSKFLLFWSLIPMTIFTFFIHFDARYIMAAASAIFIVSAVGWVEIINLMLVGLHRLFKENFFSKLGKIIIIFIFSLVIGRTVLQGYKDFYHLYVAKYDGLLLREMGLVQAGKFIKEHSLPESTFIVLGDKDSVLESCVDFGTGIQDYSYDFWSDLLADKKDLVLWEKEILRQKEKIFYVFSRGLNLLEMPGVNLYPWVVDWRQFYSLHPGLKTAKEIKFSTGIPALVIYEVTRDSSPSGSVSVRLKNNGVWFAEEGISYSDPIALKLVGEIKNLFIKSGDRSVMWPLSLFNGQELIITYGKEDIFIHKIVAESGFRQFFQSENVFLISGKEGFISLKEDGEGYFIVKIDMPGKIKELEVITNPKFFNDPQGVNQVGGFYSFNNYNYWQFLEIKSDKSNDWTHGKTTYHFFYPNSETFYIKFFLRGWGKQVRFWLNQENPILIKAKVDTSSLGKIFVSPKDRKVIFSAEEGFSGEVNVLLHLKLF
jgi:hypothetical protein